MALTTTIGGASSDSYGTEEEAIAYFLATGRAAQWQNVISDDRAEGVLRFAMLEIEAQSYIGRRADTDGVIQALEFPRIVGSSFSSDPRITDGNYHFEAYETSGLATWRDQRGRQWTSSAIPTPIKHAQFEQAYAMSQNDQWFDDRYKAQTVAVGDTRIDVNVGRDLGLCIAARKLLSPFLAEARLVRG